MLAILGLLLLSFYASARIYSAVYSRGELHRFWEARKESFADPAHHARQHDSGSPDFSLWSEKRIAAYKTALTSTMPPPMAVLRIASLDLQAPVLEGTDDLTLDRGVGHILGTALPGENGNVGIAGHRDGFFRVLKDIHDGDVIELVMQNGRDRYQVDETLIVAPADVSVLNVRPSPSLTLVTCYPFYFIGSAPQRFIVHATLAESTTMSSAARKGGGQETQ